MRRALEWIYRLVRSAYRQAYEERCAGKAADFPRGCFVPGHYLPLRA